MTAAARPSASPAATAARVASGVVRLLLAGLLLSRVVPGLLAPEPSPGLRGAAGLLVLLSLWRPAFGLVGAVALAPAGLLLAQVPAHATELLAWAFLAGWLGAVWRPLTAGRLPAGVAWATMVYGGCVTASWLAQTVGQAQGVSLLALPGYLLRQWPADHVLFSSPEPETWTALQALTGLGLLIAALALSRTERRLAQWLTGALVGMMASLGVLTVLMVLREWAGQGYATWFLMRYLHGVRASAHLSDLNAAGSQYVLAGLAAVALATASRQRALWTGAVVLMLPALWLCGSRSAALGALVVGGGVLLLSRRGAAAPDGGSLTTSRRRLPTGVTVAVAVGIAAAVASSSSNTDEQGSAANSLRFRTLFLQTSLAMTASAPVYGVGVGQYLPRSAEFMPPALHAVYPFENAHNYVAQQFAELGLVGGLAFVALVVAGLSAGWRAARAPGARPVVTGLFAASAGFLLTCLTGHPLLVPEAALPFWVFFGVAGADTPASPRVSRHAPVVAAVAAGLLLVPLGRAVSRYTQLPQTPVERGYHDERTFTDGTRYRWSTRHVVSWVPPVVGFLSIPVHAPEFLHRDRPFVVQVEIDGQVIKEVTASAQRWTTIGVSLRQPGPRLWRRVDLRVNQVWTPKRDRGDERDDRPMGVMLGRPVLQVLPTAPPALR